jgi:hypothetical protein
MGCQRRYDGGLGTINRHLILRSDPNLRLGIMDVDAAGDPNGFPFEPGQPSLVANN